MSPTSLVSLLPFLALFPLLNASPFDPSRPGRFAARQQTTTAAGNSTGTSGNSTGTGSGGGSTSAAGVSPLSFQGVGDAGISAQMVRPPSLPPSLLSIRSGFSADHPDVAW